VRESVKSFKPISLTSVQKRPRLFRVKRRDLVLLDLWRVYSLCRVRRYQYDARRTLETSSTTLRDETDLDALSGILVGVVRETMQPAHVSFWLRRDSALRQSEGSE
jgi:hypothetical protein